MHNRLRNWNAFNYLRFWQARSDVLLITRKKKELAMVDFDVPLYQRVKIKD